MRKKMVAANWKMNKNLGDGKELVNAVLSGLTEHPSEDVEVILAPPFILLDAARNIIKGSRLKLAAQNCHHKTHGAYTGEISTGMLRSVGVEYIILGHSERREYAGETDALILEKVKLTIATGLKAIYCCGEPYAIRENGQQEAYVGKQLDESILHLSPEEMEHVVVAYEPIWAIGSGLTATPAQAQEMHWFIRWKLERKFGKDVADDTTILYGGSVKADNAMTIFSQTDVDGGLIGGASLVAADFVAIANSF